MKNKNRSRTANRSKQSIILFVIGAILGMVLIGTSVYADFESILFDASTIADSSARPLQCPVFLSTREEGYVSAVIQNKEDASQELAVRVHITRGHLILMREIDDKILLEPKGNQKISWEVFPQDAVYGFLILAKVIVLDDGPVKSHKGSCGIILLKLPGKVKGWHVYWSIFSASIIGIYSGVRLWWKHGRTLNARGLEASRSMVGLTVLIGIGLICISLGFWEIAAVAFYIGLLLVGVIVPHFLISR